MKNLLLLIFFLTLTGCKSSLVVKATYENDAVYFTSDELVSTCNNAPIYLFSINVAQKACTVNCVYWEVVDDQDTLDVEPTTIPLLYGSHIPGRTTRTTAKSLVEGTYHLSAAVGCNDYSAYAYGDFRVKQLNHSTVIENLN